MSVNVSCFVEPFPIRLFVSLHEFNKIPSEFHSVVKKSQDSALRRVPGKFLRPSLTARGQISMSARRTYFSFHLGVHGRGIFGDSGKVYAARYTWMGSDGTPAKFSPVQEPASARQRVHLLPRS